MQSNIVQILKDSKVCKGCGISKPCSSYDVMGVGLRSRCKQCRHEEYKAKKDHSEDLRQTVQLTSDGRVCLSCKEGKSWDEFAKDVHGHNQKTATCKECRNIKGRRIYKENPVVRRSGMKNRPDRLRRLYGITYEQVVHMLDAQHGLCANRGCGKEISLDVKGPVKNRAVIDHNHATGAVRDLLCVHCNSTLGLIETKRNMILGLVEYLQKHTNSKRS